MDFYGINAKGDITGSGTPDLGTEGSPFGDLHGRATSAQWGDLAEKYKCEGYRGTVMCVSKDSDKDVEVCQEDLSTAYIGVISTRPGFKMNSALQDGQYVGLVGLLPVKIIGSINKRDFIVPTKDGCARAGRLHEIAHSIGVANETNLEPRMKLVQCIIK